MALKSLDFGITLSQFEMPTSRVRLQQRTGPAGQGGTFGEDLIIGGKRPLSIKYFLRRFESLLGLRMESEA